MAMKRGTSNAPMILGIIGGVIGLILASVLVGITLVTFSILNMATVILFVIGAAISLLQKKEIV